MGDAQLTGASSSGPSNSGSSSSGASSSGATPGAIYVSPDGDDGNPGTQDRPLRTVARARDLVRTRNGAMTADLTVYLRGGTYPQGSTLIFGAADSGTGGHYVKYVAYPGERPLLTGGRPITGWTLSDSARGSAARMRGAAQLDDPGGRVDRGD